MSISPDPGSLVLPVLSEDAGVRLDLFLFRSLQRGGFEVSRSALQELIKDGKVMINGRGAKPRTPVSGDDRIEVDFPAGESKELLPQDIALSVLFEDDDLIVVDKEEGLVVHPASGNSEGTLVNALLHHCGGTLCELAGEDRPGIVHRLDKDTSGCLVAAKSELAYHSLVAQFSGRETGKEYLAVVDGVPANPEGTVTNRIGRHPVNRQKMAVVEAPAGKEAKTDFRILRTDEARRWASLLCVIHTGRTHQIRVHLKECLHCPVLGDPIYSQIGKQHTKVDRLMLHAWHLRLKHPRTGESLSFVAPPPAAFERFL